MIMLKQLKIVASMIVASMTVGLGVAIASMISLKAPLPDLKVRLDLNPNQDGSTEQPNPRRGVPCPACGMG